MKKQFLVQGSSSDPYKVTIELSGTNLTALCNCPAGKNGMYCKHRFNILSGSKKNIVSGNEDEIREVVSWLPGTDVDAAMHELLLVETEAEEIKRKLKATKKLLAKSMID
jgi:uncharacterized Zn finger protein